ALVVLAAAAVTSVLLLAHSKVQARRDNPAPLSTKVVTALTVGLVSPGPTTPQHPVPARRMLEVRSGQLVFTTVTTHAEVSALEQWTSNKMTDGTYILIYTPRGLCLTSSAHNMSSITLARCTLGFTQRWRHQFLGLIAGGRYYWRLRSVVNGRCFANSTKLVNGKADRTAAELQPCSAAKPRTQIIRTVAAY
ncbi:MAG: hypothetical protein ABJB47_18225, partial [Actinomycetota bacterium]